MVTQHRCRNAERRWRSCRRVSARNKGQLPRKKLLEQALLANRRLEAMTLQAEEMAAAARVANEAKACFSPI